MNWRLAVKTLALARTPGPEVFFQSRFGEMIDIAIHVFILTSQYGTVLVDTGFQADPRSLNSDIRRRKGAAAGFHIRAMLPEVLDSEPDCVALTSMGPYAVGGLVHLEDRVPVFCSARGQRDLRDREEPKLAHPLPDEIGSRLLGATGVEMRQELAPGLHFIETGVHHPASSAISVQTAVGTLIIADPVFVAENLLGAVALGASEHVAAWHGMVRRLTGDQAVFLPIHAPVPQLVKLTTDHHGDWSASILPNGLEQIK